MQGDHPESANADAEGEVVGEGRGEERGGVRGSEAPRRSTRGDQAAVCVHIDTQSSGFGSDEAHFALQTGVECRAAEYELLLVRPRDRSSSQSPDGPGGREGGVTRRVCVRRCL